MGSNALEVRDGTQDVLDSIRRIFRALRESSRRSEIDIGITGAQLFVMQVLARETSLSINQVAERTHTHQSSVSVVIQRLVDRGLLKRERSEADGRRHEVSLTPEGRRLVGKSQDPAQVRLVAVVASLPDEKRKALALALREIVVAMSLADTSPDMFLEETRPAGSETDDD